MKRPTHASLAILSLLLCSVAATHAKPTRTPAATPVPAVPTIHSGDRPALGLSGGAASIDALIEQFLAALKAGDTAALHRLRLTKEEYVGIIVPGEVAVGQPPRQTFEKVNDVFFGMLDSKSRYTADALVQGFQGREFVSHRLRLTEGTRPYAWYTAHGQVRLTLVDADGKESELATGWIAEVDGRFKFIALNRD